MFIITGPTASGKTRAAIEYAQSHEGSYIINADALQLYKDLPLLTAAPSESDYASAPHFGFRFLNPEEEFNATTWYEYVNDIIELQGPSYILVGGTVFYIKTFLEGGLSYIPDVPPAIKSYVRGLSNEEVNKALEEYDPLILTVLHSNDTQRLKRALEIYLSTQKSIREFQNRDSSLRPDIPVQIIEMDRTLLRERINLRTDEILKNGAIEEVEALRHRYPNLVTLPIAKVIGVKEIIGYLEGTLTYETMADRIKTLTGQYAKRQVTFCRQLKEITMNK